MVLVRLTDRGIGFISTLILARLLVPTDFGLVAMGMTILATLELLSAFSFDLALIHNQQAQRHHYDTAWTFAVLFGLFNAFAMCVLARPMASFFGEPRVEGMMYVMALGPLIQGFDNVGVIAFTKDLELHKEFWFSLSKKLTGFAVTIPLAFIYQSYWALVVGVIAIRLTSLVLSYRRHPFRPKLSLAAAGDLFHFSKWMLVNNFLAFFNNRGADFVIGKISGASSLGLYSVAYEIANLPTTEMVFPIQRAVFPGYSRLAGDRNELRKTFLNVIALITLITVPLGAGIGLVAEPIVQLLLGPKWVNAVPLIQVLAIFGIIRTIHGPTGTIYLALGKPRIVAFLQCVQLAVSITMMLILIPQLGPVGAAWSVVTGASMAMLVNYYLLIRELRLPFAAIVRALWRPIAGGMVMAVALAVGFVNVWPIAAEFGILLIQLVGMVAAGAASYIATILGLWLLAGRPDGAERQVMAFLATRLGRAT